MLTISDWRDAAPHEIERLLDRERRLWRDELRWDVRHSWRAIEPARAARALPGFVAREANGAIAGWTWFLQHRGCLQVAALSSDRADVARALVDAVHSSQEAVTADCAVWSVRGVPPGLEDALQGHGLQTTRYLYLIVDLARMPTVAGGPQAAGRDRRAEARRLLRSWERGDLPAAATMFRAAYDQELAEDATVRAFAPRDTPEDWYEYLRTLVETDGCGLMIPAASRLVMRGDAIIAGIVTSLIDGDDAVAHISQIAVSPDARGEGLGRALVRGALDACHSMGCRAVTLLVGRENAVARRVYENEGFAATAEFVVASSVQVQPRRLTSVALAMGGVSTRL